MPPTRPPNWSTLIEVMQIRRVRVFVHWSVFLLAAIILFEAREAPRVAFAVVCSYFGVLLLHECGHLVAAQQKGCQVWSVELYPFWGITRYDEPYSQRDHCVIAWAGVVAQMIVAIPLVAWVERFGFTHHQTVNMVLSIFGFYSFFVAGFNLLPVVPLDGAVAWRLLPTLFRSHARRPAKREPGWRSWR